MAHSPPGSPRLFFRFFSHLLPVGTDPVKEILSTPGCLDNASPVGNPSPVITLRAPGGRPAASASRASRRHVEGASSDGFLIFFSIYMKTSCGHGGSRGDRRRELVSRFGRDGFGSRYDHVGGISVYSRSGYVRSVSIHDRNHVWARKRKKKETKSWNYNTLQLSSSGEVLRFQDSYILAQTWFGAWYANTQFACYLRNDSSQGHTCRDSEHPTAPGIKIQTRNTITPSIHHCEDTVQRPTADLGRSSPKPSMI